MMLEVDSLTHRYGDETAVEDVSFSIDEGELVAMLGPSGCGKTTIVQAIAGHVRPTEGSISLRNTDVTNMTPETRRVSVVFQQSTLYPHMTVEENVAYGLKARDFAPERRGELVKEYLTLVSLESRRDAYPAELSGGEQRRVELARALAPQPDVLLLDEPLSALDRSLRDQLRDEIARIQRETGVTTLFVTHDQEDAMALSNRLIVMNEGEIVGAGQPRMLYKSPPSPFVATFLGRSNTVSGEIVTKQPLTVKLGEQEVLLKDRTTDLPEGTPVACYLRPDDLSARQVGVGGPHPSLQGDVAHVADIGRRYDVTIQVDSENELVVETVLNPPTVGDTIAVEFPPEKLILFNAQKTE